MKIITSLTVSVAMLALAACGDSNDSFSTVELPAEYEGLTGLVNAARADELDEASETMMAGTATMSGALQVSDLGDDGELNAIGDLALTADFTGGTVTGSLTNAGLYNNDTQDLEADLTGSLTVDGTITGTSMTAGATGTLTDDEDHDLDLTLDGTFYDYEGDLSVYGDVSGTIDGEEESGGFAAIAD